MGRIHLFEFEDQPWFPSFLRNYGTDFLQFLSNKMRLYKPVLPILKKALEKSKVPTIVDLGSGAGGGLVWLNEQLQKDFPKLKIILTDLHPNIPAFQYIQAKAENFEYIPEAIDARKVPDNLEGVCTLFLALHHFKPKDAKQVLQDAVNNNCGIAIFEAQERSLASIIAMVLSPLSVLLTTPFIRPFKAGRIIFTYLIPLVPLFVLWDGVVSSLRTYSVKEMRMLVSEINGKQTYEWEIRKLKSGPGKILYLLGYRKQV